MNRMLHSGKIASRATDTCIEVSVAEPLELASMVGGGEIRNKCFKESLSFCMYSGSFNDLFSLSVFFCKCIKQLGSHVQRKQTARAYT